MKTGAEGNKYSAPRFPRFSKEQEQQTKSKNIHLVAIMGDKTALEEFLKAGVKVDARDRRL
jgi:hypothetical protein